MSIARLTWRKSSRSGSTSPNCVELADVPPEMAVRASMPTRPAWRKSVRSSSTGANCVELADFEPTVAVRDSKHPDQAHLTFSRRQFTHFAEQLKRS